MWRCNSYIDLDLNLFPSVVRDLVYIDVMNDSCFYQGEPWKTTDCASHDPKWIEENFGKGARRRTNISIDYLN